MVNVSMVRDFEKKVLTLVLFCVCVERCLSSEA